MCVCGFDGVRKFCRYVMDLPPVVEEFDTCYIGFKELIILIIKSDFCIQDSFMNGKLRQLEKKFNSFFTTAHYQEGSYSHFS